MDNVAEQAILEAVNPHLQMYDGYRQELRDLARRAATQAERALEDVSDVDEAIKRLEGVRRDLAGHLDDFMSQESASSLAGLVVGVVIREEAKRPEVRDLFRTLAERGLVREG